VRKKNRTPGQLRSWPSAESVGRCSAGYSGDSVLRPQVSGPSTAGEQTHLWLRQPVDPHVDAAWRHGGWPRTCRTVNEAVIQGVYLYLGGRRRLSLGRVPT